MNLKKFALPIALTLLLLAAAYGARPAAPALSLGWYGDACDDAEAQNPGDPAGCRYDARERDCGNGVDDDSDERTDQADPDCWHGDPVCESESAANPGGTGGCYGSEPAHCGDGLDNDGDGDYDCSDADCAAAEACQGCAAVVEVCDNGRDDDCDNLVDSEDQDCGCTTDWYNWWQPKCGCPATELDADGDCAPEAYFWGSACADGNDNDGDGAADCQDGDCAGDAACYQEAGPGTVDGGNPDGGEAGAGGMNNGQEPGTEDYGMCGNGICETGEEDNCFDCVVCGDGTCDSDFESYFTCPGDCPNAPTCGDGTCEPAGGETPSSCPDDCGGYCGDGKCDSFSTIFGGTFEDSDSCPEDCSGGDCGDGTCDYERGETAQTCSLDCAPFCGNGTCDEGEDAASCEEDCGSGVSCGDGLCDPTRGEDAESCAADCGYYCGDGSCHSQIGENADSCPADCYEPQMRDPEGNPV